MQLDVRNKPGVWFKSLASRLSPPKPQGGGGQMAADWVPTNRRLGLSTKLLMLTVAFVMLAEVFIFVPSVANFRIVWLGDRITAARIAGLAADASNGGQVPIAVRRELLRSAKVHSVSIRLNNRRRMVLPASGRLRIDQVYDLRPGQNVTFVNRIFAGLKNIGDALAVFVAADGRTILIRGHPMQAGAVGFGPDDFVEIALSEAPLKAAMIRFSLNILLLSIVISIITAAMIYFALNRLMVAPIRELTGSMLYFADRPEDPGRVIIASQRGDEIGTAERELERLQNELQQLLKQKNRLAQLGLAVSKINHDLRNMLASAQLISDRLSTVEDPTVQRFAPKLIASLDRAINFCAATLQFGRAEEAPPRRDMIALGDLVEEVGDGLGLPRDGLEWVTTIAPGLLVDADRDHLYRILNNLLRNAVQAVEAAGTENGRIEIGGEREAGWVRIRIADNGPGVPDKARKNLFKAFQGGVRKGGTGLGLAIAAELVRAHGGRISIEDSADVGAVFLIELPDRSMVREAHG